MHLAVAYDITDDTRRRHIYKTLKSYGAWKQYSVFELEVTKTQRVELEDALKSYLEEGDKMRIYTICDSCSSKIKDLGSSEESDASNVV